MGTVDKDQGISRQCRTMVRQRGLAYSLVSHNMILWVVFSVTLLITYGADVVIPGNPIYSQIFFPKILWGLMILSSQRTGIPAVIPHLGNCSDSEVIGSGAICLYFSKYVLLISKRYCCS